LRWAYENADGEEVVDGSVLGDVYYETRLPIVKKRIMAAGVRLAATLEVALSGPSSSSSSSTHPLSFMASNLRIGLTLEQRA
jgi:hypothetical protein